MSYETKFVLIRHAEAMHLVSDLTGGWTDSTLTEKGIIQAHNTGKKLQEILANTELSLIASDLRRAKQTAEIIGSYLDVKPVFHKELRELNNGLAVGMTKQEAKKIAIPKSEPVLDWVPYPEGESWRMLYRRMESFFSQLLQKQDRIMVIVGHGNALCSTMHWWLKIPEKRQDQVYYLIEPSSITILAMSEYNERMIVKLNDTCHLYVD